MHRGGRFAPDWRFGVAFCPMPSPLMTVAELARSVDDPHLLIVDCRFELLDPQAGEAEYRRGHIPGALYAHLDRDLSSPITAASGRHPLPTPEKFAATATRWGISAATHVVSYDADNSAYAARLWWLLRWLGHERASVLNGGFKAWRTAGLPTSLAVPAPKAGSFIAKPNHSRWVSTATVAERVAQADWAVLDARAPERFAGEVEPVDRAAGHVPGARNHPLGSNLALDSTFLDPTTLRTRFEASLRGVTPENTIAMCGSGVTACQLLLAMEASGLSGAKLYAGSWSEWSRDPKRPIAKGRG
jgi:thiosulfate/3-mercaptopyruvate sulfurtransferase